MKPILTILFLALTLSSTAQKIRFTDSRNYWYSTGSGIECPYFTRYYEYGSDSMIHGLVYKHLLCGAHWDPVSCTGFDYGNLYSYYVREDTVAGYVYYVTFDIWTQPDTREHILYNYNLNVGDTIRYAQSGRYTTDSVTNIESAIINGVNHKIIRMQNKQVYGTAFYTIIEGIGCTAGPLLPTLLGYCFEYEEKLMCFAQDTAHPPFSIPVANLCGGPTSDTFNNSYGCAHLATPNIKKSDAVVISPNPASSFIDVASGRPFTTNTFITVYDMTAKIMIRTPAENQNTLTINTASWTDGIYMIIIQDNTGILKMEKVVVQH